jgi:UDP-N-acetylmuramate--alanine ligase
MKPKKVHFMGVGGSGCSAAFAIAHGFGFEVTGCDRQVDSIYLDKQLKELTFLGHDRNHLKDVDYLVFSPAIISLDPDNVELLAAMKRGIPAVPWDKFVADFLVKDKFLITVSGTHGKGTVSAMISVILERSGLDPTCLIGANLADWGKNYRVGESKYFVLEADEYSEKLLNFQPNIAVINNIEFDHPEYFKDEQAFREVFEKFVKQLPDSAILILGPSVKIQTQHAETKVAGFIDDLSIKMIGTFNQENASIAYLVGQTLGLEDSSIKKALSSFGGLARRFEFRGEEKGVVVFDDFAHHPTAVSVTLEAAREKFPQNRIWVVFQPHLFTRTKVFLDHFAETLSNSPADEIIVVDIYAAREKDREEISSQDVVKRIKNKHAVYIPSWQEAATFLVGKVFAGDVVITMGAGDMHKLSGVLLTKLRGKG